MILEEIGIANWRGYRERHTFRFTKDLNVLLGANEAGKSTLFEAMARGFFDRHGSSAEEIKQMRPIGSTLGPEVTIIFQTEGVRYKLFKQFLVSPSSRLYVERGGNWELDHEDDVADLRIRQVLNGREYARATKAEHRGLAQALWYIQGDPSLPEKAWSDAVQEGLAGLVRQVVRSPREAAMIEDLSILYKAHWTPQGRPKAGSEGAVLEAEIPELEGRIESLRARLQAIDAFREDIEQAEARQTDKVTTLKDAERRHGEAEAAVETAREHEEATAAKGADVVEKERALRELEADKKSLDRRDATIKAQTKQLPDLERKLRDHDLGMAQEMRTSQAADRLCEDELHPKLKALEREIVLHEALHKLRTLEKTKKVLDTRAQKVVRKRKELVARKNESDQLNAPSAKEMTKFRGLRSDLTTAEANANAAAIYVDVKLRHEVKDAVQTEPAAGRDEAGSYLVTQPTRFDLKGIGHVAVRGGGSSLADARREYDKARELLAQFLARFGAKDDQALSDLAQAKVGLQADVSALTKELTELEGEEPPDEELRGVLKGIKEEMAASRGVSQEALAWGGQKIRGQIEQLKKQKQRLIDEIAGKRLEAQRARDRHVKLVEARTLLHGQVTEFNTNIRVMGEENAELLRKYGNRDRLIELLATTERELKILGQELDEMKRALAHKVEGPRAMLQQVKVELERLETDVGDTRSTIVDRLARIEQETASSSYSALADLEIELEAKNERLIAVRRRANAIKVLSDLVTKMQTRESADLAGPVGELMARWLSQLTNGNYSQLQMDGLVPTNVHVAKYGLPLPMECLSFGTHEQVILLLRLAMGVLLSKSRRQLVVLDDRLVNADQVRMKRLCIILQEAAQHCQIIIATCNDTPYAGLNAHTIEVPTGGRLAVTPLGLA